ncbi:transketolase [Paracoccaceae bacterium GXU_MW_L88]
MELTELKSAHPEHWDKATALRVLALDAVDAANSGHSGMPMGMADVATVLFTKHLKFDAKAPRWFDRDRFILSAGHGSMLIYGLLHLTGYEDMTIEQIRNFRQLGSITAGHPEYGHVDGVETTTGPLGQGLANSVGFAMAEAHLRAKFGKKLVDHHTYVIAGDGCLMEGVSEEAIGLAGRHELERLIVFWDDNNISIDGKVSLSSVTDQRARFRAHGWEVLDVDGHNPDEIDAAITKAKKGFGKPVMIACKTHIGFGAPTLQDTNKAHGAITGDDEVSGTRKAYGWEHGPFEIPADIKSAWEEAGQRGAEERKEWEGRVEAAKGGKGNEFRRLLADELPKKLTNAIRKEKKTLAEEKPKLATRASSQRALEVINPIVTETIGGSADLTGSNNTNTDGLGTFDVDNRTGRHVHYGIREHGMAAAMNGMRLHGGVRPYGGTFLTFSDYARPSMRLSALMGIQVTYVMTHDSIGVGEDGPTHQPVEHVAALRAIPNMTVIRPADAVETLEAWEYALTHTDGPTTLALSRQGLPAVRDSYKPQSEVARGAYILAESEGRRRVILIATGSEVSIAMEAKKILEAEAIGTRVVSMPSMEIFAQQDEKYRKKVLPAGAVRVGVEAAVQQGWDRWLTGERGRDGKAAFVGMEGFGASAPAGDLYKHFGITADAVADAARALL